MNTAPTRHCRTCGSSLPADAHHSRRYCNYRCRRRALKRRESGRPEADPLHTPEEVQTLQDELAAARHENQRLHRLITRINTTRRRWKKRAEYAAENIRQERARVDRIELIWAQRARDESDAKVPLLQELERARLAVHATNQRIADYEAVTAERDAATRYAKELAAAFASDRQNVRQIVTDWDWIVSAYFRPRSTASLTERELAIRTRWVQFRRRRETLDAKTSKESQR